MRRTSRLATLLGLFVLVGLAFPPSADAQRRGGGGNGGGARGGGAVRPGGPAGPAGRGGAVYRGTTYRGGNVAVPRSYRSYSHYGPANAYPRYYRPYYYRPYYYRPYYAGYYPYYYAPWSFGLSVGIGWYGAYASSAYAYAYPPARYVAVAPPSYVGSAPEAPRADDAGEFGTLSLRVMPSDATIVIDRQPWDRPQGDDRFSIELTAGPHHVEIRKPGHTTYVRIVDVPRGQSLVLNVALPPAGSGGVQVARTVPFRQ
jgi:hypothetical protein